MSRNMQRQCRVCWQAAFDDDNAAFNSATGADGVNDDGDGDDGTDKDKNSGNGDGADGQRRRCGQ